MIQIPLKRNRPNTWIIGKAKNKRSAECLVVPVYHTCWDISSKILAPISCLEKIYHECVCVQVFFYLTDSEYFVSWSIEYGSIMLRIPRKGAKNMTIAQILTKVPRKYDKSFNILPVSPTLYSNVRKQWEWFIIVCFFLIHLKLQIVSFISVGRLLSIWRSDIL